MLDSTRPGVVDVDGGTVGPVERRADVGAAFETYHAELFSFLRRGTRDAAAAEDLLQDAFLRLAQESEAGRSPDNIRAWLYRVAANLAISRARRGRTAIAWMSRVGRPEVERMVESPEAATLDRERSAEIDRVLAGLSAEARTALLLSSEGFSGQEIAVAIGRSYIATRTLMSRARVRVREELERREGRS